MKRSTTTPRENQEAIHIITELMARKVFASQTTLAQALGVKQYTISNWLGGRCNVPHKYIDRLREIFREMPADAFVSVIGGVNQVGNGVAVNTGVQPAHSPHDVLHIYRDLLIKRVIEADFMDDATKFKVISLVQTTRLAGEQ